MLLVLMTSWLDIFQDTGEPLRLLELFAGQARLTRLAKALNLPAEAHDLAYDDSMDINSSAGLV